MRTSRVPPVRIKIVSMFPSVDLFHAGLHAEAHLERRLTQTAVSEGATSDICDAFLE